MWPHAGLQASPPSPRAVWGVRVRSAARVVGADHGEETARPARDGRSGGTLGSCSARALRLHVARCRHARAPHHLDLLSANSYVSLEEPARRTQPARMRLLLARGQPGEQPPHLNGGRRLAAAVREGAHWCIGCIGVGALTLASTRDGERFQ